jgi:hypothetical protein
MGAAAVVLALAVNAAPARADDWHGHAEHWGHYHPGHWGHEHHGDHDWDHDGYRRHYHPYWRGYGYAPYYYSPSYYYAPYYYPYGVYYSGPRVTVGFGTPSYSYGW